MIYLIIATALLGIFALAPAVSKMIRRARIEQFGKDVDDE